MMKKIGLSVVAAALVATAAQAEMDVAGGKLSAEARAQYIADGPKATGLGVNVGYTSPELAPGLTVGLGAAVAMPISETNDGDAAGQAFGKADAGDATEMNLVAKEAYVQYLGHDVLAKVGYQKLDTPLAGSDDVRLYPNTFSAAVLGYLGVPNTTLIAAQVMGMNGWDSAGNADEYASMSVAAVGVGEDASVTALAAIYGKDKINAQAWYYMLPTFKVAPGVEEGINALYVDGSYAVMENLTVSAQYYSESMTEEQALQSFSVMGLKVETSYDSGISAMAAYNSVSGDGQPNNAWGGYPEYAIADEFWMNSFGDTGTTSFKVGVGYDLSKAGLGDRTIDVAYVSFSGDNLDQTVTDIIYNCTPMAAVGVNVVYEMRDGDVSETNLVKLGATYSF